MRTAGRPVKSIESETLLIAEVLSPSAAKQGRITKRRRYQRSGVEPCWIADLDARLVEVWRTDARPDERITWQPDPAVAPLAVDLAAWFREI
jgi:Uma2 family endonuclease